VFKIAELNVCCRSKRGKMTLQGPVFYSHLLPLYITAQVVVWEVQYPVEVTGEGEGVEASEVEAAVAAIATGMDEGTIRLLQHPDDDGSN
jgi:hypothetical protein